MAVVRGNLREGQWSAHAKAVRNFGAYRYAKDFRTVALKAGSPIVRSYLLGHALELYLKAFLYTSGFSEKKLRSKHFGHDLDGLLEAAVRKGLGHKVRVSDELRRDMEALNTAYSEKALEYFSLLHLVAPPPTPDLRRLARFSASLDKLLEKLVANAVQQNAVPDREQ